MRDKELPFSSRSTGWLIGYWRYLVVFESIKAGDSRALEAMALANTSLLVVLLVMVALVSTYIFLAIFRRKQSMLYKQLQIADLKNQDQENLIRIAGRIAHLGGWSVELPARTVSWSPEIFDIFELPRDQQNSGFGMTLSYFSEASQEYGREVFRRCVEDGTSFDEELEMTTLKETGTWIRAIGEAVRGDGGKITRIQGAIQEITGNKKISEEIRAGRNQFQRTLDSLSEAVFVTDSKDRSILLCNQAV